MSEPTVVITNKPFPETVDLLAPHCRVVANSGIEVWEEDEKMAHLAEATAMMAFMPDTVDAAFLEHCPKLKLISCALKGYDNFDLEACSARGVLVTFVADLLTNPTAELAVGLTIGLARNLRAGHRNVSGGYKGWRAQLYGKGLDGSQVGLLGAGAVGRATAERLQGFGCQLRYFDETPVPADEQSRLGLARASLTDLLGDSDFLIVCLPLNSGTLHLLDAGRIAEMKPGAHLINISRGSVVDEKAVADALEAGHLAGYAADVFELEDWALPARPREIDARLLHDDAPTLFTPHLGSAVVDVRMEIERQAAERIVEFLNGATPRGVINAEVA